jgi:hypothetical protein
MDEKALARAAAQPGQKFAWPVVRLSDGSVADY